MARRLERHGLKFDRPPLPALVAPLPAPDVPLNPDVHVWRASSRADLQVASIIRHVAFRFPPGEALDYFEAMSHDWLGRDCPARVDAGAARLYLARLGDGPPAAISALVMGDGLPGVYVMATLPEFRRRGLGQALLSRTLADAADDDHCLIVLTASDMGYPLYRQFGFEHVFDYVIYRP
jgi:GNAT superfamily N-acetyltransferase